jgi:hypothetical protein
MTDRKECARTGINILEMAQTAEQLRRDKVRRSQNDTRKELTTSRLSRVCFFHVCFQSRFVRVLEVASSASK